MWKAKGAFKKRMGLRYRKEIIVASVIFLLCCTFVACGSKEESSGNFGGVTRATSGAGNYFLLLGDNETISLNTYENNTINEIRTFQVSDGAFLASVQEERVAILNTSENTVTLYEIQISEEIELSVPYRVKPKAILLHGGSLFIGGAIHEGMGEEMLIQYHIQSETWYQLEIPENLLQWGKAVDDLVVNDRYLIAIDNVVLPKFILFYHLDSTGKLEFSHYRELKSNGPWETIRQGRITPDYLGLLSRTESGWVGPYEHITIYDNLDLTSSFTLSIRSDWHGTVNGRTIDVCTINDFLLVGNQLFLAHSSKGLGVFEIDDSYFGVDKYDYDCNYDYFYLMYSPRVDASKINYTRFDNEEIIQLTLISNDDKFVLTIRNETEKIRHEVFCVQLGALISEE